MAAFIQLDDSPMFQKQIYSLEQTAEELRDRCHRLYKGCTGFMAALGESCSGDTLLADSLEAFGGGQDDAISVSIGGPVISKFVSTFHELASYKELLRSQVEHVLVDRLKQLISIDLQGVKESRRQLDKAMYTYDQARERFVSLKKNTREDIISQLEEDLQNSKSAFERSRFNLVNALMNVEAKKKYEFLESFSAIMDAHLRYFKLGYDLLSQMEPFIHQVLTYAQQSKEMANIEQDKLAKRIQEFRTQSELDSLRASSAIEPSVSSDGVHAAGMDSYKSIEAIMQSTRSGQVQTIKQGYLLKRSSSLRGDWKRRFFVLDSQGAFYYYKNNGTKLTGSQPYYSGGSAEHNGVFGRFRSKYGKALPHGEGSLECKIVDLHTSTIKLDADDSDLRLCFRIISPAKTYTLQAENEADRMDWMNKTKAVIASLFNSHFLQQPTMGMGKDESNTSGAGDITSVSSRTSFKESVEVRRPDAVAEVLRTIAGNDLCAECCSRQPDWASLNLGILLCIECSGLHRNLGVHISKVRSITLDVKVWEPTILDLFCSLGNTFCNSIWEGMLLKDTTSMNDLDIIGSTMPITKPSPNDAVSCKEKYIHAKYVEKLLVVKHATESSSSLKSIWQAVESGNLQEVYRLIVTSKNNIINTVFDDVVDNGDASPHVEFHSIDPHQEDPTDCERIKASGETCLQGCSLLHMACQQKNPLMVELLLQFGADINMQDYHKRTPLHYCISMGNNSLAKFLLKRGARPSLKDGGGFTALERAMEMGAITDEELFILLAEGK